MREIKKYECESQPTEDEIFNGIVIAKQKGCIVLLEWFVPYSGWHEIRIEENTTYKDCIKQIPKYYSV